MQHRLLLVDDDMYHLESSKEFLEKRGFKVDIAQTGSEAVAKVREDRKGYSLVVLDFAMDGLNGAETCEALKKIDPNIFILIFTGVADSKAFVLPLRQGANALVDKHEGVEVFLAEVKRLCREFEEKIRTVEHPREIHENEQLVAAIGLVGCSPAMAEVAEKVVRLRRRSGSVLIVGETGAGKEAIARALRFEPSQPFVAINCGKFAASMGTVESELFGHARGAFTGANSDKEGILEQAHGGIVLLDEIDTLPIQVQDMLLRALQEKKFTRLGSSAEIALDVRLVCAGKPSLIQSVGTKAFKADFFHRISRNIISVPPLKARKEDILPLVGFFCREWSRQYGEKKTFLEKSISVLRKYNWPGNVRELENFVWSTLDNLTDQRSIGPGDVLEKFKSLGIVLPLNSNEVYPLADYLADIERARVIEVLGVSKSIRDAAKRLAISPQKVLRLSEKYNIDMASALGKKPADIRHKKIP